MNFHKIYTIDADTAIKTVLAGCVVLYAVGYFIRSIKM